MTKPELLAALDDSRQSLLAAIDGLPDEAFEQPGVVTDWSVKDLLSHLTAWEAELVKLLAQARQGRRPAFLDLGDTDSLNHKWHAETKDRALERVLADFHGVRKQTLRQVEGFSDRELGDPKLYKWLGGRPLSAWIADETYQHEAEHAGHIRLWREASSRSA
jgi:hypothetical protein